MSLIASNNKLNPINMDGTSDSEMTSLAIDNTTISEINFVRRLRKLRELYAGGNRIESFDVGMLTGCRELTYISLQSNPLVTIKIAAVDESLPNLKVLDVSKSSLETDCRQMLELFNLANDKSLNLNIDAKILSGCLRI